MKNKDAKVNFDNVKPLTENEMSEMQREILQNIDFEKFEKVANESTDNIGENKRIYGDFTKNMSENEGVHRKEALKHVLGLKDDEKKKE